MIDHRIEKWAAIEGKWKFSKSACQYLGPTENQSRQPIGMARAASRFRDGTISLKVKLSRNKGTTAGVFVRFQSIDSPYCVVGIGAFDRAYAIFEYHPGAGWIGRAYAGSLSNLNSDEVHEMKVVVSGQSVKLAVDEVDVLSTTFSVPLEGTGLGLYAYDDAAIEFSDVSIAGSQPKVFVMMPFAEPCDTLYREVISPVAVDLGFEVVRVDEVVGPGIIVEDIQRQIEGAHAVVAEISTQNPNVFYELGYAHALRKPAVLLVRRSDGATMPFDIRSYRAIFYDDSIGGKKSVERNLQQHLEAVLGGP
jgi:hypothetical protein